MNIYTKLSDGKPIFLDKTPRYYLILDELHDLFPDAKFIYLFRNPVSIFSSMIEAFRGNKARRLDHLDKDLYLGPQLIAKSYLNNKERIHLVKYESLIKNPEQTVQNLCDYLEIEYSEEMITKFITQEITGHGDQLGSKKYKTLTNNTEKWKSIGNSVYRKKCFTRFMKSFNQNYLDFGQYNRNEIINEIHAIKSILSFQEFYFWLEEACIRFLKKILKYKSMN